MRERKCEWVWHVPVRLLLNILTFHVIYCFYYVIDEFSIDINYIHLSDG